MPHPVSFPEISSLLHTPNLRGRLAWGGVTTKEHTCSLTCVCAYVPLQVEGVVEALVAEGAQVPLLLVVALKVTVEHAQQAEALATQGTVVNHGVVVVALAGGKLRAERTREIAGAHLGIFSH